MEVSRFIIFFFNFDYNFSVEVMTFPILKTAFNMKLISVLKHAMYSFVMISWLDL